MIGGKNSIREQMAIGEMPLHIPIQEMGKKQADVMMIMITMPEEVFFEDMKRSMNTLFEGLQPVQSPGKQKPAKKHNRLER